MKKILSLLMALVIIMTSSISCVFANEKTSIHIVYNYEDSMMKEVTVEIDENEDLLDVANKYIPDGYYVICNFVNRVGDNEYVVDIDKKENNLIYVGIDDIKDRIVTNFVYIYNGHVVRVRRNLVIPDLRQVSWMLAYQYVVDLGNELMPFRYCMPHPNIGKYKDHSVYFIVDKKYKWF